MSQVIALDTTTSKVKLRAHFELTKDTHTSASWASYGCLSWVIWRKVSARYREHTVLWCDRISSSVIFVRFHEVLNPRDCVIVIRWDSVTLQWRHDKRNGVSNHRRLDCLLSRFCFVLFFCFLFFRRRSKKTSKLQVTDRCEGNPLVTGGFPSHRASNTGNVSIWWRHYNTKIFLLYTDQATSHYLN